MSSKRRLRRRSCEGKKAYATAVEAEAAAKRLRGAFWTSRYRSYKCQFCGRWHAGRASNKDYQAMRADQANRAKRNG